MEQESGGKRGYRSAEEMASARRLKNLTNKTWFRSKRGGIQVTPNKDLPQTVQNKEQQARSQARSKEGMGTPNNKIKEGNKYYSQG